MISLNLVKIKLKESIVETITYLCAALKLLFTVDEVMCL